MRRKNDGEEDIRITVEPCGNGAEMDPSTLHEALSAGLGEAADEVGGACLSACSWTATAQVR